MKIANIDEKRNAINCITAAERNIKDYPECPTLTHKDNRDFQYRAENIRETLRMKILKELEEFERLESDDEITLGRGGAKPKTKPLKQKNFIMLLVLLHLGNQLLPI